MNKLNKIFFLVLGILSLVMIEMDPSNTYGLSRMARKEVKGQQVMSIKDFHLPLSEYFILEVTR